MTARLLNSKCQLLTGTVNFLLLIGLTTSATAEVHISADFTNHGDQRQVLHAMWDTVHRRM